MERGKRFWKGEYYYKAENENRATDSLIGGYRGRRENQLFERLMTVEDLADALGFAPQTIRNWVAMRQMPYLRIGGKTRFRWSSLRPWLERKEFQSWH